MSVRSERSMSNTFSDQEIVAILAGKIGAVLENAEYDDNGNLVILNLSGLNLSQVPVELGQLTNLQELYLNRNQLSQVPVELGQLTNLQALRIDNNQFIHMPVAEIKLTNLKQILIIIKRLHQKTVTRYESNHLHVR